MGTEPPSGSYQIAETLGHGRLGVVHRAVRRSDGRPVAFKFVRTELLVDEAVVDRLFATGEQLAGLDHPRLVRFLDVVDDGSSVAVVTELVDGGNLRSWAAQDRTVGESLALLSLVADGLAALHARAMVHADLKPENVLLAPDSQDGLPRLSDFGLAPALDPGAGRSLPVSPYVAPEVAAGRRPAPASDLFSLGVLLHELTTGRLPALRSGATDPWQGRVDPVLPADMPEDVAALVLALLSPRRSRRPCAAEAAGRLAELAGVAADAGLYRAWPAGLSAAGHGVSDLLFPSDTTTGTTPVTTVGGRGAAGIVVAVASLAAVGLGLTYLNGTADDGSAIASALADRGASSRPGQAVDPATDDPASRPSSSSAPTTSPALATAAGSLAAKSDPGTWSTTTTGPVVVQQLAGAVLVRVSLPSTPAGTGITAIATPTGAPSTATGTARPPLVLPPPAGPTSSATSSSQPTVPSGTPASTPTSAPTSAPTTAPTSAPTTAPTSAPTTAPTSAPTTAPTSAPTTAPTSAPTTAPTSAPTTAPTSAPTTAPTSAPTTAPTSAPTTAPAPSSSPPSSSAPAPGPRPPHHGQNPPNHGQNPPHHGQNPPHHGHRPPHRGGPQPRPH